MFEQKNRISNHIPAILFGLAILGWVIVWIVSGGTSAYHFGITRTYNLYSAALAIVFILPFLIYIFTSKSRTKTKLIGSERKLNNPENDRTTHSRSGKNGFDIYVINKSNETIIVNRESELENNQWFVFQLEVDESIYFSNGIIFSIDNDWDLEVEDPRNQIIGLADDWIEKYGVPEYVNWAFVITELNEGPRTI